MIFEDSTKKNWKRAKVIFICVLSLGVLLVFNIVFGFVTTPNLFQLRPLERDYGRALPPKHLISSEVGETDEQHGLIKSSRTPQKKISLIDTQKDVKFFGSNFLRTAFVLQDDEKSQEDLKKHIADLDIVFPDWFSLGSAQCQDLKTHINKEFQSYLSDNKKSIFPRFSNTDIGGVWKGAEFMQLIKNQSQGDCLIAALKNNILKNGVEGVNLDIENLEPSDREFLSDWLVKLVTSFHANSLAVTIDLPVNDNAFDYEFIGSIADRVVLMAYDEHYSASTPGPIASKEWFENALEETLQKIPKQKLIVAMGNYAYDWIIGDQQPAKPLGFADAMMLAKKVGADVETDKTAINSYFFYADDQGRNHAVWLLDAVSFWNSYHFIAKKDVSGISFWRLGIEDPGIWKFFGKDTGSEVLSQIDALDTVIYEGEGQLYKVTDLPTSGLREITTDEGFIDYAQYTKIPTPYVVEKFFETHKPQVLFTFDDGPDPVFTPQILAILKKYTVSGIFFMVGDQIERYPDVAKQVADAGHFIGNHTFNHPNIADISDARLRFELNSTQRFIESTTGRSTILFRAPYDTDADPTLPAQLKPLYIINTLGYTAVGGNVDSSDYKKPGVDYMVQDVMKQLDPTTLNIVVMHDAGGDRTQTVAALEKLIPAIRSQGYDITSLDKLLGLTRNSIMPRISFGEQMVVWGNSILSFMARWGWGFIAILFLLTTIISIFRVIYLGYFVFRGKDHTQKADLHFMPPVTVVIPAYNEEKVIERTLQRIMKSHYESLEILVINDGSTDKTAEIVRQIAKTHPQVKLISKENGGKWTALNLGFQKAKHEFIVTIDADTLITLNTIKYLVAPFIDPSIDAVCGNIEVGNVRNILTAFQEVEYITSQNYDRRAFDELNCISVVPGATGAWKKSKILSIGGYSGDTLTEDADLTLTLLSQGGKIVYSSQAKSITEAPETIKTLYKQRFRWTYGTFQCLWKHRGLFGQGSVGWVAIPNMFLFQVVFPILSPLGDLVFILALIRGDSLPIIVGYITFLIMDLAGTLIALTLEQKPLSKSWVVLIQRFFYRQFMYVITYKSIIASLRGNRHGWNKLERTANIHEKNPS